MPEVEQVTRKYGKVISGTIPHCCWVWLFCQGQGS